MALEVTKEDSNHQDHSLEEAHQNIKVTNLIL